MAADAVGIAPGLVPLSQVLAGRPLGQEPAPGFPGLLAGQRVQVTAVLERRAVVEEAGGDRRLADPQNLMVDPEHIRWQGPAYLPAAAAWRRRRGSERDRQEAREASDRRALEDQARQPEIVLPPADPAVAAGSCTDGQQAGPNQRELRAMVAAVLEMANAEVAVDDLRGPRRDRQMVRLRRVVAAQLREQGLSLPAIGRAIGREHTTVLHLLRTGAACSPSTAADSPGRPVEELEPAAAASPPVVETPACASCGGQVGIDNQAARELPALVQALVDQALAVAEYVGGLEAELEVHRAARRQLRRLGRRAIAAGGGTR